MCITKFLIIISLILVFDSLHAQVLFSKHFTRDSGYFYFSSVEYDQNNLYVLVHFNDPSIKTRYGSSGILTLDHNGNIHSFDTIHPTSKHFYSWPTTLQLLNDSTLLFISHDSSFVHAAEFNIKTKHTKINSYPNQYGKRLYGYAYGFKDSQYSYMVTNHSVRRKPYKDNLYWAIYDAMVLQIDSTGIKVKNLISFDTFDLLGYNLKKLKNGNIAVMGKISNFNFFGIEDGIFRNFIYEYDDSLQCKRKLISPEKMKLGEISDMVEDREGRIYAATNEVLYKIVGGGSTYETRPAICKYSSDGRFLWSHAYVPYPFSGYYKYYAICFDNDSSHIVAAGFYESIDTSIFIDSMTSRRWIVKKGLITKTDLDGNLIWNRTYIARGDELDYNYNEFTHIKRLDSGGYILCGSSEYQQSLNGWLMKVDEHGCLIPGCHLVNADDQEQNINIKLFPNPAVNYLSIIHGHDRALDMEIYNAEGKRIMEAQNINTAETNIFDISKLTPGEYIAVFKDRLGQAIFSEKIIIGR